MGVAATTRLIGMVGDPIAKARTPGLLNERFSALGRDVAVVPFHIPAAAFGAVFPALLQLGNLDGLIVTYHFKERCLPYAQRLDKAAQLAGGLNDLRPLTSSNGHSSRQSGRTCARRRSRADSAPGWPR